MGLDMYLVKGQDNENEKEIHYWRKAYPIMDWFENQYGGVENLQKYKVSKDDMINLKDYCEEIYGDGHFQEMDELEIKGWTTENELAEWFDWHMEHILKTKDFLEQFLKEENDWEDIYFFAWW